MLPAAHAQTPGAHAPCAAISHCFSLEKSNTWPQRHRQAPLLATNSDEIAGQNEPSQGRFWPDKHHEARREEYRSQRPRALGSPAQGSLDNTASARRSSLSQTPDIDAGLKSFKTARPPQIRSRPRPAVSSRASQGRQNERRNLIANPDLPGAVSSQGPFACGAQEGRSASGLLADVGRGLVRSSPTDYPVHGEPLRRCRLGRCPSLGRPAGGIGEHARSCAPHHGLGSSLRPARQLLLSCVTLRGTWIATLFP